MAKKTSGLTVMEVRALKPRDDDYEVRDEAVTGGYVVVRKSGKLSYVVRYRIGGVSKKLTVGVFDPDDGGLTTVRALARTAQNDLVAARRGAGLDPAASKQAQRRAEEEAAEAARLAELAARANTFNTICDAYLDDPNIKRLRPVTLGERKRQIDKELRPVWGDRPITSIVKKDVKDLLRPIAARGPYMANRVFATLRHIFNWAKEEEFIATNPTQGMKQPLEKETERERVLSDAELALVWRATETLGYPWTQFYRLAILTGARKAELARAVWSEFDLDTSMWSLPAARSKNKRPLERPLSPMALDIMRALPRMQGAPFIFGSACASQQLAKSRLDAVILDVNGGQPLPGGPFVTHDLRRTFATGLQALGAQLEVTERLLGHIGESQSGIRKIYQRHSFAAEKAEAVAKWADHIAGITSEPAPAPSNVVALAARTAGR
jgi:integrase